MSASKRCPLKEFRLPSKEGLDYVYKSNCANNPPIFAVTTNIDGTTDLVRLPCRRWKCTYCSNEILIPRLFRQINAAIKKHDLNQWLTLTIPHDRSPSLQRYCGKTSNSWSSLRNLYRKHYGHPLSYIWVREIENDWPHLHVFTTGIKNSWVKREWHARTGGQQIYLRPINGSIPRVVGYALKDIAANAQIHGRKCGRWWGKSQDITFRLHGNPNPQPKPLSPTFVTGYLEEVLDGRDYQVTRADRAGRPISIRLNPAEVAA
jgi:hypothetical protein